MGQEIGTRSLGQLIAAFFFFTFEEGARSAGALIALLEMMVDAVKNVGILAILRSFEELARRDALERHRFAGEPQRGQHPVLGQKNLDYLLIG